MRIKHILLLLLLLVVIYFDFRWYCIIKNNDIFVLWTVLNVFIGAVFIAIIVAYLYHKTYFFETIGKILNKKVL